MYKMVKKLKNIFSIVFAILLILFGAAAGIYWYYLLAPLKRLADNDWQDMHSQKAIWLEEQESYRRYKRTPDIEILGDVIRVYGDKKWLEWMMRNIKKDPSFYTWCWCTKGTLSGMTNHLFHERKKWLEWYARNKSKSQEELIQDGFREYGVEVHLPPTKDDILPLLNLMGNESEDKDNHLRVLWSAKYNAYRWLRDSGFNPVEFVLARDCKNMPEQLKRGIKEYFKMQKYYPSENQLGLLAFAEKNNYEPLFRSNFKSLKYQLGMNFIIFFPTLLGLAILHSIYRKRKSQIMASKSNSRQQN